MQENYVLFIYDIESTRERNKVINVCKDFGLRRLQLSVFEGLLTREKRELLFDKAKAKLKGKSYGRIHVFMICEGDMKVRLGLVVEGESNKGSGSQKVEENESN